MSRELRMMINSTSVAISLVNLFFLSGVTALTVLGLTLGMVGLVLDLRNAAQ